MKSQSKSRSFEIAIIDGINIFVKKVLIPKGIIPAEKVNEIGRKEIIDLKYDVARTLAKQWSKMAMDDDP